MRMITLTFPHVGKDGDMYRVDTVVGSTAYDPGKFFSKEDVDDLCQSPIWKVTIKRNIEKR